MVDVREVIAEAVPCNIVYGRPQAADEIIHALTAAGFRIIAPDEVDQVTDGPVPTFECEFRIGQMVKLANPYAEDDPDRIFYVTGIDWEYRDVAGRGWNITIATADDIERRYGATDGFAPSDLLPAAIRAIGRKA